MKNFKIDYKDILLGTFIKVELEPKYKTLIKVSKIKRSRYDLITDSAGNIYITGYTSGNLNDNSNTGGSDVFL